MLRQTFRSLLAHKLRLLLTTIAIVLGVGFVSGTFVLTDTMNAGFDEIFDAAYEGVDVQVTARTGAVGDAAAEVGNVPPVPAGVVDQVAAVDGVASATGEVEGYAQLIGSDGEPVGGMGPPALGFSLDQQDADDFAAGGMPGGPDEVVIDKATAAAEDFAVGDQVQVVFASGRPQTFTVSGLLDFEDMGGTTLAGFDLPTAQKLLGFEGSFTSVTAEAAEGVSQEELRDRVAAAVGDDYETVTGAGAADEASGEIREGLGFFNNFLLAFGAIALFVGAFIINNTFSIIIAQRTRELALLRCLGASRAQVRNSVLVEALIVGAVASVIGLAFGVGLAVGFNALLAGIGIDLPSTAPQILPRTVIVAVVVGIVVTLLSALVPARKATRVPPVAALRQEAVDLTRTRTRLRTSIGAVVTLAGVAALVTGLFADVAEPLLLVGGGALVILLGVGVLGPLLARPLARVIGLPVSRWLRLPGTLARQNAMRNPKRTAATASALMIGLALVSFVSIFGASAKASIDEQFEEVFRADYALAAGSGFGPAQPISPAVLEQLQRQPEVAAAAGFQAGPASVDGASTFIQAADPDELREMMRLEVTAGSLDDLGPGGIAVSQDQADSHGWTVGSEVPVSLARGSDTLTVRAVYDSQTTGPFTITKDDYQRLSGDQSLYQVMIRAADGVAPADSRAAVEQVIADYPTLRLQDQAQIREQLSSGINTLLNMIYALLGMSILIALFGIVNTLVLSIFERIRELGLLRAVGMERRQVRSMIRWEAVIIAVIGAVLGLVVGSFFGWTTVEALSGQGFGAFTVPFGQLALFLVLAAVAGVLAAVVPGRRAARIDMLRAISTE